MVSQNQQTDIDTNHYHNELVKINNAYARIEEITDSKGSSGEIYLGWDYSCKRFVAIKHVKKTLDESDNLVHRFYDEVTHTARCNHENIVSIFSAGESTDLNNKYIIMEYIDGVTLEKLIDFDRDVNKPELTLDIKLYIIIEICKALEALHNLKDIDGKSLTMIHRDIHPQNKIISSSGDVKTIDFGIAKSEIQLSKGTEIVKNSPPVLKGHLCYWSPEYIQCNEIDEKHDIYLLGLIFFELLYKKHPYSNKDVNELSNDEIKKIKDTMEKEEIDFDQLHSFDGGKLKRLLSHCLAHDPEQRKDSTELLEALVDYYNQQGFKLDKSKKDLSLFVKQNFKKELSAINKAKTKFTKKLDKKSIPNKGIIPAFRGGDRENNKIKKIKISIYLALLLVPTFLLIKPLLFKSFSASILIDSSPQNAQITINDSLYTQTTPFLVDNLKEDSCHIKLTFNGFTTDTTIYISTDSEPLTKLLIRFKSTLHLQSEPEGAKVFNYYSQIFDSTPDSLPFMVGDILYVTMELNGRKLDYCKLNTADTSEIKNNISGNWIFDTKPQGKDGYLLIGNFNNNREPNRIATITTPVHTPIRPAEEIPQTDTSEVQPVVQTGDESPTNNNASVKFIVKDSSGNPISDCTIHVLTEGSEDRLKPTDPNGISIDSLSVGIHKLRIRKSRVARLDTTLTIQSGIENIFRIELRRN